MKILAIVPARKNSKRLPKKNIRMLGNKHLIEWTISNALKVREISDVLISTDDPEIVSIVNNPQVLIPWMRPAELSTEEASSADVAIHGLDWYETNIGPIDGVLLLQPTSPFRTVRTIKKGIEIFKELNVNAVLSVTELNKNIGQVYCIQEEFLKLFYQDKTKIIEAKTFFVPNGLLYLVTPDELRNKKSFIGSKTHPLIIPESVETIDIDTQWDLDLAKMYVKNFNYLSSDVDYFEDHYF